MFYSSRRDFSSSFFNRTSTAMFDTIFLFLFIVGGFFMMIKLLFVNVVWFFFCVFFIEFFFFVVFGVARFAYRVIASYVEYRIDVDFFGYVSVI